MKPPHHFDTKLIHAGEPEPRILGAVVMPIFQSAMYEYAGEPSYHDLQYIRLNNTPNHASLHAQARGARGRRGGARHGERHGGDLDDAARPCSGRATTCSRRTASTAERTTS